MAVKAAAGFPFHVTAGAEGALANARENDHADIAVLGRGVEGLADFLHGVAGEGIQALGAVDRDGGHQVLDGVQDVGVRGRFCCHGEAPLVCGFLVKGFVMREGFGTLLYRVGGIFCQAWMLQPGRPTGALRKTRGRARVSA